MRELGVYPLQLACLVFNNEKPEKICVNGQLMDTGECRLPLCGCCLNMICISNMCSNGEKSFIFACSSFTKIMMVIDRKCVVNSGPVLFLLNAITSAAAIVPS